ncbi:MAG: beta-lactamase family protein [Caldilineaceae bacterium]|nr:beta-lactamase family protein [Caldilineaceae bacterium]
MERNRLYSASGIDLTEEERGIVAEEFPRMVAAFEPTLAHVHAPGLAMGVVVNGELAHIHVAGKRNLAADAPVAADTVFRIASMTKSFGALAILQLRDAGLLELDHPAARYLPELAGLAYPSADSPPVTIRRLLTMQAGLPQDDPWADRQIAQDDEWLSDFLRRGIPWSNPPGVTFEYSNLGYMILGRVIAAVSGQSAQAYINANILAPLGMTDTVWAPAQAPPERLAWGYDWLDGRHHALELLPSNHDGAVFAGLFTTLADLSKWITLFNRAWPPGGEAESSILQPGSLREMQQIWSPYPPVLVRNAAGIGLRAKLSGYGYGLSMTQNEHTLIVGHSGGLPGFGSNMQWATNRSLGIIALANVTYAGVGRICGQVFEQLTDRLHKNSACFSVPSITPPLTTAREGVNRLLERWDDAVADALFAENFFLDLDRVHWQQELLELSERHGALREAGAFRAENWLRGSWRMQGERGWCDIWLSLAPTHPPAIQELEVTSVLPPTEAGRHSMEALARLISRPTRRELDRLRAADSDRTTLWRQIGIAHQLLGPCSVGELLGGDGATEIRMRLVGAYGNGDVEIHCDARGRVACLRFMHFTDEN